MLLDTTFLIDLMRGDERAVAVADELENDGEAVADGVVIIGATAAVTDEPVLTRNVSDFERLSRVEVETY